eukprot:scaffold5540_cov390-Prasinococcus_capsulatus_cf.AAC.17
MHMLIHAGIAGVGGGMGLLLRVWVLPRPCERRREAVKRWRQSPRRCACKPSPPSRLPPPRVSIVGR